MTTEERAKDALRGDLWAPSKECKEQLIKSVAFHIELAIEAERERCIAIIEDEMLQAKIYDEGKLTYQDGLIEAIKKGD